MAAPKLRFKEFDGDWFQSKIGEIFQVTSGSTPLRSDNRFFENADIVWVKTTDLNNGLIEKTEEKISQIALKETSVKILPKGTVFVAMYGGFNQIGRTGLLVHEAACNQALSAIYPNEKIDSYFLLTFLNHKVDDWKNFAASSRKDPNITKSDVLAFPLKYPVKEEQTKIASFLSNVDEKISQLTQKHQLLSQYKQGMMQKLFSQQIRFKADDGSEFGEWNKVLLGDCVDILTNGLSLDQNMNGNGFKVTRIETISNFNIDLSRVGYVDTQSDISSYRLVIGDILFSNINSIAHIGKVVYIDKDYDIYHGMNLLRIQFKKNLDKKFMFYELSQKTFKQHFESIANKAVNQASINQTALKKTELCAPCLEEQIKIANFLSAIDQKIEVVAEQIEQAKTWKKGLLQQMFI